MNSASNKAILMCALAFYVLRASAQPYSGLSGLSGEFIRDYAEAEKTAGSSGSVKPLLVLQRRYTNDVEQTELEVTLGFLYSFRTGIAEPSNAMAHLTAALSHGLPEKTLVEIFMYRGGSQEQLKHPNEALKDYLRGLLACSYHDLSGGWPEIQSSKVPIYINSSPNNEFGEPKNDPENAERLRDYNRYRYRQAIDYQRFLFMHRYYFIEAVKRLTKDPISQQAQIMETLGTLSPDSSRFAIICDWLKSENKRPWP